MARIPLIHDGDMGGDDLWAVSIILAHQDRFDILGFATCFGNIDQPFATDNLLNHMHWIGQNGFEIVQGSSLPCDGMHSFGDGAYGENGVGGIIFEASPESARQVDIADWYAAKVDASADPVTIFCTGPATNIAHFIEKHPQKLSKVHEIIFMGGSLNPPGKDGQPYFMQNGQQRIGNITLYAEFNAYQDPKSLNILLNSGVKLIFAPADVTQFMVFTEERQNRIKAFDGTYGPAFHRMLNAVEPLDRSYFGVEGAFIHDPTAAVYLLAPELFGGEEVSGLRFDESSPRPLQTTRRGQASTGHKDGGAALWLNAVKDQEQVFDLMVEALRIIASRAKENRARPAE
jgi:purine nucleosidase